MVHLSVSDRLRVVAIYNQTIKIGGIYLLRRVSNMAKSQRIEISENGVRYIINKWIDKREYLFFSSKTS
jgi:hypothetical protein